VRSTEPGYRRLACASVRESRLSNWLRDENIVWKRYPPPITYLALLSSARGDTADACECFAAYREVSATFGWQDHHLRRLCHGEQTGRSQERTNRRAA